MTYKEAICDLKSVLRYLRRTQLIYDGQSLTTEDGEQFVQCIQLWYLVLIEIPGVHTDRLTRGMCSLFSEQAFDVLEFGRALDEIIVLLRKIADSNNIERTNYNYFKHSCGQVAKKLLALVKDDVIDFLDTRSVESFKILNQAFSFPKRIQLRDIDLQEKLEKEYRDNELRLAAVPHSFAPQLRAVIKSWNLHLDMEKFIPRHGPGRTAESSDRSTAWKFNHFLFDDRLLLFFRRNSLNVADYLPKTVKVSPGLSRRSTTIFVPKSIKTKRTISAEPASLMYFQQALREVITKAIATSRLSEHIHLEDQVISQREALSASLFGDYATIDYSAASDSLSWKLIKEVFPPQLSFMLYSMKTDETELPSGDIIKLEKSSPMGSAVCFPVESMIFAGMAELACNLAKCHTRYFVYGDDVILPTDAVEYLLTISSDLGCKLNSDKSYWNVGTGCFREACGIEAYNGQDVTPLMLSRQYYFGGRFDVTSSDKFSQYKEMCNGMLVHGFRFARRFLLQDLQHHLLVISKKHSVKVRNVHIPFSYSCKTFFLTPVESELNWQCNRRFNKHLFRNEVECISLRSSKRQRRSNDDFRYQLWLQTYSGRPMREERVRNVYVPMLYTLRLYESRGYDPRVVQIEASRMLLCSAWVSLTDF